MPLRDAYPEYFLPTGISDSLDQTNSFNGACQKIQNLLFDRTDQGALTPRPGVKLTNSFAGFNTPGVVSVQQTFGQRIYGMIGTARNAGKDEPFVYDIPSNTFITVSNVLNANTPITQSTSGAWTPPTIELIGTKVIVTHPGWATTGNFIGWFDITTPATPSWNAGNTTTNVLPTIPIAVGSFFNRAWYACGNAAYISDSLVPLTITYASQILTLGDADPIVAFHGVPLMTTSTGILGSLLAFKNEGSVFQITGDLSANNLSVNEITDAASSVMVRTICSTVEGVAFCCQDGPRLINQQGVISFLANKPGEQPDIVLPFTNATNPTRACGWFENNVYRVCLDTTISGIASTNDYWFDYLKRRWNGPHTFIYHTCSSYNGQFFITRNDMPGALFMSEAAISTSSQYVEPAGAAPYNTATYAFDLLSANLPVTGKMLMHQVVESTMEFASSTSATVNYNVTARDETGNILNQVTLAYSPTGALWGTGIWGVMFWSGLNRSSFVQRIHWTIPLVFKKLQIEVNANVVQGSSIKNMFFRYQDAGYMTAN